MEIFKASKRGQFATRKDRVSIDDTNSDGEHSFMDRIANMLQQVKLNISDSQCFAIVQLPKILIYLVDSEATFRNILTTFPAGKEFPLTIIEEYFMGEVVINSETTLSNLNKAVNEVVTEHLRKLDEEPLLELDSDEKGGNGDMTIKVKGEDPLDLDKLFPGDDGETDFTKSVDDFFDEADFK